MFSRYLQLVLRSSADDYERLREAILSFGRLQGYAAAFLSSLELALKEAFVNAFRHGNHERRELPVTVTFDRDAAGKQLLVTIGDCGCGFAPDQLPDPTTKPFLQRLSGRGVFVIRHHAEIVDAKASDQGFLLSLRFSPY